MATLNENVAKTKTVFRGIRDAIDTHLFDNDGSVSHDMPTEHYQNAIQAGAMMKYSKGQSDGVEFGKGMGKAEILAESKYIPKQVTGKVISLNDVSEVAHKVKVYGDNQEVDVYRKNLLPYPYAHTTRTTEGITFTDNGNGTITANGTATGNAYFSLTETSRGVGFNVKAGEQYVLRGCPDGGSTSTYMVYSNGIGAHDYGNGAISTISTEDKSVNVAIAIFTGVTVSNLIFKPMISLANISDKTYEPFTRQTITATPNGTEIDSICPCMRFFSDCDITVDYYSSFGMAEFQSRFADSHQQNGARTTYTYAFGYSGWNDYTFEQAVNYDIVPSACNNMFDHSLIKDLAGVMKRKGIVFDFIANAPTQAFNVFVGSHIEHIPEITMPTTSSAFGWYTACTQLRTIDGMVCNEKTLFQDKTGACKTFQGCSKLTRCIFGGVIANDINLQWSPLLDEESLISLTETLRNLYEDINWDTGEIPDRTLTLHSDCWDKLKSMIYPDEAAIEAGLQYSYYDAIINKGWKTA